jgi:hypothetical protein
MKDSTIDNNGTTATENIRPATYINGTLVRERQPSIAIQLINYTAIVSTIVFTIFSDIQSFSVIVFTILRRFPCKLSAEVSTRSNLSTGEVLKPTAISYIYIIL